MLKTLFLAAFFLVSDIPVHTSEERLGSFRLVGAEFSVPLPDGYCLAQGRNADVAQLLAAADTANVTHLSLYLCDEDKGSAGAADYILIKTPSAALSARLGRAELLAAIGAEFETKKFKALMASNRLLDDAGSDAGKVLGTKVSLGGTIQPLGKDETCGYLGGVLKVEVPGLSYDQAVGGCISAVGNRVLTVFWYGRDASDAGVGSLMSRSRKLMESIRVKPLG